MIGDREERLADLVRSLGRSAPGLGTIHGRRTPRLVSAAMISKPRLMVLTLRLDAQGRVHLEPKRSTLFDLEDRSAAALDAFRRKASSFFNKQRIDQLYLRTKGIDGQFIGHPLNYKIEAVLQLLPGLSLTFVDTQSVQAWVRRADPEIPLAPFALGSSWGSKQQLVLETALFVPQNPDHPRAYSDGSSRDG